jgi:hypothetical protein
MLTDAVETMVWIIRLVLFSGLAWGAWLCLSHTLLAGRSPRTLEFEHFATFALLVLLLTSLGGLLRAQ